MGAGFGLGDAEFGADFRERSGKQSLVVPGDISVAFQATFNGRGEEFGGIGSAQHRRNGLDAGEGQHAHLEEQEGGQQG